MKSLLVTLSVALLLAGCASTMRTEVTQFSSLNGAPTGRSFAVFAEPAQSGNLEFQHYAGLVSGALQTHGFTPAPAGGNADVIVVVHYGSVGNHTEIYGDPAWGAWGGYGYGWRRRWGPGWHGEVESTTYYAQSLEVQLFDGAAWRNNVHTMLYQGRAVGDSPVNDINAAVPALVTALFTHFPGNSGQTERVLVPLTELPPSGTKAAR